MHKYIVSSNQFITSSTILLTLSKKPDSNPLLFRAGQYGAVSFHRDGRLSPARCFSIVSSPTSQETIQFSMRVKGRFTKAIAQAKVGDEIDVRGPYGSFVFDVNEDKELVFIAGGIGITPFISMMQYATDRALSTKITLIYGCSDQDDIPFMEQLESLAKVNSNLRVIYVISNGPINKMPSGRVGVGRMTQDIISRYLSNNYASQKFMICGPVVFMKAISKVFEENEVEGERIITEAFTQGKLKNGRVYKWPMNIYIAGAASLALGSFAIMAKDLIETMPATSSLGSASDANSTSLNSSRQHDLDQLVNELHSNNSSNSSSSTAAAQQAASSNSSSSNTTTTPTTTQPTNLTPAVQYTPKCTTSQSGTTTCI